MQCLFWPDMAKHLDYAAIAYSPSVHKDGVLGLRLLSHNNTVVTVSRDPLASVCIRHVRGKFDSYTFKLGWGVRCFDFVEVGQLQVLATGSNDKVVRLWHPVVTSRPASVMRGHKAGINDVKIHAEKRIVFSYDKECVIKVWSLDEGHCHQTVPLQFPSLSILGKEIEFGRPALYQVDDATVGQSHLVATCCQYLTLIALKEENEGDTEDDGEDDEDESENDERNNDLTKVGQQQHKEEEESRRQSPPKPATTVRKFMAKKRHAKIYHFIINLGVCFG